MKSNCLFFAFRAWIRWYKKEAWFSVRRSHHVKGLHWGVYYKGRMINFVPVDPAPWYKAWYNKIWFRGKICRS